MMVLRSLYAKIFGWFWLTLAVGALLVLALTWFTGTQSIGRRWTRLTQDMYAHSAMEFYETGGEQALRQYLAVLHDSSGIQAALLDEQQHNVIGDPLPPDTGRVLRDSVSSGQSSLRLARTWTAASPVHYGSHAFFFVLEVHPSQGFVDGTFAVPALGRIAVALLVAAVFCMFLTRHIVAPVRALQLGAQRLADGDLNSRVLPGIAPRDDEIADTARAFDRMADSMQLLIQRRQELLADISHELRSPLTRISVSLELILRGETDVAERMQGDVERMNTMIGQILLLTRLDLQPLSATRDSIAMRAMLETIAKDAEFEAQRDAKIVRVDADQSCTVCGDANLIRSCIENVVRNAIHYTAPHSQVQITARGVTMNDKAMCEIVVTDQGPGVPEEALPRLYDPFFRVAEARVHDDGGTGLGLSISRKIAELHGGSIHAENVPVQGGFRVTLRFHRADGSHCD